MKIIMLIGCLMFSSIQAAELNTIEIMQEATELAQHHELVMLCRTLRKQGLSSEQIVKKIVHDDVAHAHFNFSMFSREQLEDATAQDSAPIAAVLVGLIVLALVAELCCICRYER